MADTRRVVITGVSRGLGRAMVEEFIRRGHVVFGCARGEEPIDDLSRRHSSPHAFSVVDVTKSEQVNEWSDSVEKQGGAPDILINNAALINENEVLWKVPGKEFADLLDVNLRGVHNVICAFVPEMVERASGVILNFSSTWGRTTSPNVAPYCATKWGVEGLTQALAHELPRGMAAIPFNPGVIQTEMLFRCFGESARSYPTPGEWAKTAVPYILRITPKENGNSLTSP